jgi:hypothetical protein
MEQSQLELSIPKSCFLYFFIFSDSLCILCNKS